MNALAAHRPRDLHPLLAHARRQAAAGRNEEARTAYLEILSADPAHAMALDELGHLAYADGHRSAAQTIYEQLVRCHPRDAIAHANLGRLRHENGDLAAARVAFEAALAIDSKLADAHRGLAQLLEALDDAEAADRHWRQGFGGQGIVPQPYRGQAPAVPVLLLVSAKGGNIPTRHILDDRIYAVTALYVEYHNPNLPLPPHALLFNAIGDADLCDAALTRAEAIVARTDKPVINQPSKVRRTGRASNAARLGALPSVHAPAIHTLRRGDLTRIEELAFPLLLRAPGYHTGQYFVRVERRDELEVAAAALPGDEILVIEYLDARGADGMARKYRVMFIDGMLYPLHLAISVDWKVHYFSAGMATNLLYRREEKRFLEDMPAVIGASAMSALVRIHETLGLEYAGIDFAVDRDGSLLLFEVNATMVIIAPPPDPVWDYRRAPIARALHAASRLALDKIQ